jgi:hypothetical protein
MHTECILSIVDEPLPNVDPIRTPVGRSCSDTPGAKLRAHGIQFSRAVADNVFFDPAYIERGTCFLLASPGPPDGFPPLHPITPCSSACTGPRGYPVFCAMGPHTPGSLRLNPPHGSSEPRIYGFVNNSIKGGRALKFYGPAKLPLTVNYLKRGH